VRISRQQAALVAVGIGLLLWIAQQSWRGAPVTSDTIYTLLITGVTLGSIYAIAASGVVVTYTTSGIFNFAQGAIGMFMAFVYWELRVNQHLPAPLALFLAVVVIAPLLGALIERLLNRWNLLSASLVVQIVVTLGLMFFFLGLAGTIWDPTEGRSVPAFFASTGPAFHLGTTAVTWHRTITICVAIAIAVLLRLLLYRTRMGVTMRAVVDNRSLAGLHGARPTQASMLAWALGSSMAAISGILLAPELGLQADALTLLIINAFAAAIIGRLRSLPLTYAGGILLGLAIAFATIFLDFSGRFSAVQPNYVIPMIVLFVALLAVPFARIELRRAPPSPKLHQPRVAKVWETALGMSVVWIVVFFVTRNMGPENLNRVALAIATAILMLSLVPLTGWAGQISLAQITFAGAGAFAVFQWAPFGAGSPLALLVAAAFAIPFGVAMALPALRLQGLYLALASLAFAVLAEKFFFGQPEIFGNGARLIPRISIFGYRFTDDRAYLLLITAIFGVMAMLVVWLRRGAYGRRLVALRDSEAASATLGMNRLTVKLSVYALSAAMAGFAGALLAMERTSAATEQYTMLIGIPIVLLVVVGGVECVSGALIGGILFILFPVIKDNFDNSWLLWVGVIAGLSIGLIVLQKVKPNLPIGPRLAGAAASGVIGGAGVFLVLDATFQTSWLSTLERLGPGLLALNVALRPNGAAVELGFALAPLLPWRKDARHAFMQDLRQRLGTGKRPPPAPPVEPGEPVPEAPVPAAVPSGETASSTETRESGISWKAPT